MMDKIDKRDRSDLFRDRLNQIMLQKSVNQSMLARKIGVDRSTISQILNSDGPRLPNAQVIAECANALGVSSDWLLGLSDYMESAADVLNTSLSVTSASRALLDEQIFEWHKEAEGYKIRHVPATLPDMFKTDAMLEWEYTPNLGRTTQQAINATRDRLNWISTSNSDYEIALPTHEVLSFANSTGYYENLPSHIRNEQMSHLLKISDELYPRVRLCFFDAHKLFSAPITVFGPLLAVIYLGQNYFAFRDKSRVKTLSQHFDMLVRKAHITARDVPQYLSKIRSI